MEMFDLALEKGVHTWSTRMSRLEDEPSRGSKSAFTVMEYPMSEASKAVQLLHGDVAGEVRYRRQSVSS